MRWWEACGGSSDEVRSSLNLHYSPREHAAITIGNGQSVPLGCQQSVFPAGRPFRQLSDIDCLPCL